MMSDLTTAQKLALLAEKRAKREAEFASQQTTSSEARELADLEAIDAAEEKHGPAFDGTGAPDGRKIGIVRSELGVVIVKRPNHLIFKRFQDCGDVTSQEFDRLVRPSLVHPDSATWDRYIEEQPALLTRAANMVAVLAGVRMREVAGK